MQTPQQSQVGKQKNKKVITGRAKLQLRQGGIQPALPQVRHMNKKDYGIRSDGTKITQLMDEDGQPIEGVVEDGSSSKKSPARRNGSRYDDQSSNPSPIKNPVFDQSLGKTSQRAKVEYLKKMLPAGAIYKLDDSHLDTNDVTFG